MSGPPREPDAVLPPEAGTIVPADQAAPVSPERLEQTLSNLEELLGQAETPEQFHTVEEAAEFARRLAKRVRRDLDLQNRFATVRMGAKRQFGRLLLARPKHPGGRPSRNPSPKETGFPTLKELKVSRREAAFDQELARMSDAIFSGHIRRVIDRGEELTAASFKKLLDELDRKRAEEVGDNEPEADGTKKAGTDAVSAGQDKSPVDEIEKLVMEATEQIEAATDAIQRAAHMAVETKVGMDMPVIARAKLDDALGKLWSAVASIWLQPLVDERGKRRRRKPNPKQVIGESAAADDDDPNVTDGGGNDADERR